MPEMKHSNRNLVAIFARIIVLLNFIWEQKEAKKCQFGKVCLIQFNVQTALGAFCKMLIKIPMFFNQISCCHHAGQFNYNNIWMQQ